MEVTEQSTSPEQWRDQTIVLLGAVLNSDGRWPVTLWPCLEGYLSLTMVTKVQLRLSPKKPTAECQLVVLGNCI